MGPNLTATPKTLKLSEVECCFGTRVADIELQAMDYKSSACPYLFFSPGTDVPGATLQPVIIGPMPQSVSPKAELLHVFPVARPQPESPVTSLQFDFQRGTGHWHQPDSSEHARPQDANLLHDKLQPAPQPASAQQANLQSPFSRLVFKKLSCHSSVPLMAGPGNSDVSRRSRCCVGLPFFLAQPMLSVPELRASSARCSSAVSSASNVLLVLH